MLFSRFCTQLLHVSLGVTVLSVLVAVQDALRVCSREFISAEQLSAGTSGVKPVSWGGIRALISEVCVCVCLLGSGESHLVFTRSSTEVWSLIAQTSLLWQHSRSTGCIQAYIRENTVCIGEEEGTQDMYVNIS